MPEEGSCCTPEEEAAAIAVYDAANEFGLTGQCASLYQEVRAVPCRRRVVSKHEPSTSGIHRMSEVQLSGVLDLGP